MKKESARKEEEIKDKTKKIKIKKNYYLMDDKEFAELGITGCRLKLTKIL